MFFPRWCALYSCASFQIQTSWALCTLFVYLRKENRCAMPHSDFSCGQTLFVRKSPLRSYAAESYHLWGFRSVFRQAFRVSSSNGLYRVTISRRSRGHGWLRTNNARVMFKVGLGISRTNADSEWNPSLKRSSSIFLIWKRKDSSVALQSWSWRGKPAASARAGLQKTIAGR